MKNWYVAKMVNDFQGLVIDEQTGKNIAVTYDKKDAPLVAAAPELLEACHVAIKGFETAAIRDPDQAGLYDSYAKPIFAAIREAEGNQ